jgi:hypothetical protein
MINNNEETERGTLTTIVVMVRFSGIRTSLQAYGFIHLKASKDPIEGIQQLEYLNLVSSVQRMTKGYIRNSFKTAKWNDLTTQEQVQMG